MGFEPSASGPGVRSSTTRLHRLDKLMLNQNVPLLTPFLIFQISISLSFGSLNVNSLRVSVQNIADSLGYEGVRAHTLSVAGDRKGIG